MDFHERAADEGSEDDGERATDANAFELDISKAEADANYNMAGDEVEEQADQISLSRYQHLLSDKVHNAIMEVLEETKIKFRLADFQLVSLHVLGSQRNLVLISPTGSGKMLGNFQYYF